MKVEATVFLTDDDGNLSAENEAASVTIHRTDHNEVCLEVRLYSSEESDDASIYLTVSEASRLAHLLGIAVLANEAAAHEAASL